MTKNSSSRNRIESLERRTLFSGGLDPTFGTGGYAVGPAQPPALDYVGNTAVLQSDGKLVFAGINSSTFDLQIRRYLANGQPDTAFGTKGITSLGYDGGSAIAAETPSGKLVVTTGSDLYVLTGSGALDPSFRSGGHLNFSQEYFVVQSLAFEGTQILLGGYGAVGNLAAPEIRRLNADGTLDPTFAANGVDVLSAGSSTATAVTSLFVMPSGTIAAGTSSHASITPTPADNIYELNADGSLLKSFGESGVYGGNAILQGIEPDGSLLVQNINLVRITPNGQASDPTFAPIPYPIDQLAVEADGSVLVGVSDSSTQFQYEVTHYSPTGVAENTSVPIAKYGNSGQTNVPILPLAGGSYLLVGEGTFFIEKLTAAGVVDTSFGIDGDVAAVTPASPPSRYSAIVVQPDGKPVVGGLAFDGVREVFDLTRYNINGTLDTSFGTAGVVMTTPGLLDMQNITLLIQPNGKIVAAGNLGGTINSNAVTGFSVVRLNPNGTLDKTFGTAGTLTFNGDENPSLLWQSGKLLVGSTNTIRRLNANGSIDTSFKTGLPGGAAFAVQPDARIVAETTTPDGMQGDTVVTRFNVNGLTDTTFGSGGSVTSALGFAPAATLLEPNGTIVTLETPDIHDGGFEDLLVAIKPNGAVDSAFGTNGTVVVKQFVGMSAFHGNAMSLVQQPDGKLIVTASLDFNPNGPSTGWQVARYSSTGQLDTTFGKGGTTTINSTNPYSVVGAGSIAAIAKSGRLYLAGGTDQPAGIGAAADIFAIDTNNDTGTISGYMFYDFNGNGKRDPGDHALNWTCYIDVDNDGHYDNADIRIHTDAAGNFTIPNLAPGVYHIRQSQVSHWQKTTPAEYTVAVTPGANITGVNFGSRFIG